ncbi:hypothetical protein AgCh_033840 [Apium graveolens]
MRQKGKPRKKKMKRKGAIIVTGPSRRRPRHDAMVGQLEIERRLEELDELKNKFLMIVKKLSTVREKIHKKVEEFSTAVDNFGNMLDDLRCGRHMPGPLGTTNLVCRVL